MAKALKSEVSSDEAYSSEEEAQVNDQVNVEEDDDEELHAVARSADSDEEAPASDDEVVPVEDDADEVLFDLKIHSHELEQGTSPFSVSQEGQW
uniref:Uncharacterized protein n=1 Tax=Brassica oleracea TaxID=3712 RepID=A0A3P6CW30_BRAOL|nr:unnamed protein product [Brassica oleracea]